MSKHLFAIVRLMKLFFNNYLQRNLSIFTLRPIIYIM